MGVETWLWAIYGVVSTFAAVVYHIRYSVHRDQVVLLQAQRRMDSEARENGQVFTPRLEGLWSDLDVESRLRARIKELENA